MRTSMTSSLILLVALTVGCHGNYIYAPRPKNCQTRVMSCGYPFRVMIAKIQQGGQFPDVAQICQVANHARKCFGKCMFTVFGNSAMSGALDSIIDYVCDESRRDWIDDILSSECFVDGSIWRKFVAKEGISHELTNKMAVAMTAAFARGEYNYNLGALMCPLVDNVMDFIDNEIEDVCGEKVVPFINDIVKIVYGGMFSKLCSH